MGNIKWLVLAVVVLTVVGVLRNAKLSPEEKAAKAEQREKSAQWAQKHQGRER